jgi:hypothetical protein
LDGSTHRSVLKKLLAFAAIAEAATGLALLVVPSLVGRLLLGTELSEVCIPALRVLGIALMSLGVACCPYGSASGPLCGMLTYSSLATLGLLYLALIGQWKGPLLWPAVVLHAVLTFLLAGGWCKVPALKWTGIP